MAVGAATGTLKRPGQGAGAGKSTLTRARDIPGACAARDGFRHGAGCLRQPPGRPRYPRAVRGKRALPAGSDSPRVGDACVFKNAVQMHMFLGGGLVDVQDDLQYSVGTAKG